MKAKFIWLLLLIAVVITIIFLATKRGSQEGVPADISVQEQSAPTERLIQLEIVEDSTYGILMQQTDLATSTVNEIYQATEEVYDLASIRLGRTLDLYFDLTSNQLNKLIYQIDTEEELHVTKSLVEITETQLDDQGNASSSDVTREVKEVWQAARVPIEYDISVVTKDGQIDSSMYQTALDRDIDIRAIIELANAFQWTIDFAIDPRVGDTFKFIYEERYRDGEYIGPGTILAGRYVNDGTTYDVFYFEETQDNTGFFDSDGNSVQKIFLKAPVSYRYISSGFTAGRRYIQAFNVSTGHRAIDYAAAYGTPVRSVGDGTITFAGWNSSGYGNFITVHHNGTYSTNYAHLSRIFVTSGQRVTQGETIGAVGSTGFSTGPHLHYEMVKHGTKVNPLREVLPPGKPIAEENKQRFFETIKVYQEQLAE